MTIDPTSALWSEEFARMRADEYHWTNNQIILDYLYQQVSGEAVHWLPWLMSTHFADRYFDRALSIGCGDGVHEVEILRSGRVGHITGTDVSEGALATARKNMAQAGFSVDRFDFYVADGNKLQFDSLYDVIFNIHSAHHISNLEGLFDFVVTHLAEGGVYVFVEFIGPTKFQWTDQQLALINRLTALLPDSMRNLQHEGVARRPSIEDMDRFDPSESVRSGELMTLLEKFFDLEFVRSQNGTLLHQLYPLLNGRRANKGDEGFDTILKLLIEIEKILTEKEIIAPDFIFAVCRPKSHLRASKVRNEHVYQLSSLLAAPISNNPTYVPVTFAQCGEDLIVESAFRGPLAYSVDKMRSIKYLEIGGGFPIDISNTYLFYRKYGASGIVFEPDGDLVEAFRRVRPRDMVIQGIVSDSGGGSRIFHLCKTKGLSSCELGHIKSFEFLGLNLDVEQISVSNYSIGEAINKLGGSKCDLLSVDAEGLDADIICAIDLNVFRPVIVIFEKSEHYSATSASRIKAHLHSGGYVLLGETDVNIIMVDGTCMPSIGA